MADIHIFVQSLKRVEFVLSILLVLFLVFLSFRSSSPLEPIEKLVYDVEMRLDLPRSTGQGRIAIVNIDEKSLKQLGPWPWPRDLIAEMIRILKANGAKLIGLDLVFSRKEQNQGLQAVADLLEGISSYEAKGEKAASYRWILERLKEVRLSLDHDAKLVEAVREAGNVILPVIGKFGPYSTELAVAPDSYLKKNCLKPLRISTGLEKKLAVNELIGPFPELGASSYAVGHVNLAAEPSLMGQVHLPFINYRGNVIPSLPLQLALRDMNRKRNPRKVMILGGKVDLDGLAIPLMDGELFVKFRGARRSFPYYSFADILRVKKVPAVFDGKIVLIGFTAKEGGRSVQTPVDPQMPRVELEANIVEDLLEGRFLRRPRAIPYIEALLILLLGISAAMVFPHMGYTRRLAAVGMSLFFLFLMAIIVFVRFDVWFKIAYSSLGVVSVLIIYSVGDFVARERSLKLTSKESVETNRMLGLSLQSQGLLDLAFEKFRKCPLDDAMRDVLYNLGLDFERKRMVNKAISVYEYILQKGGGFRDLKDRIPKLRALAGQMLPGPTKAKGEAKILVADDLETKPTVGRYEILGELGQGAMGMVYKGRDPKINRLVAIKTIRFADDFKEDRVKEVKERFLKEAELAGKLSHPSIIAIYDVGEDYDLTYMAMELLEGKDLEHFCHKEALLPQRQVIDIIADTAEALDYAHTQGVIHRDVKPANIMLLTNGRIKVTDFGIAKAVSSSQTKSGIILGTPNYMAPEQIAGGEIDGRTDVFSLGVVFFQLLTGDIPFRGKTLTELFYQITQAEHPSPRELNPRVLRPCEQLIDKALSKDPDKRFQRASEFARYLRILGEKIDQVREKGGGGRQMGGEGRI